MRFFIRTDQDNRIIMKVSASEPVDGTVEISEEEYRNMDMILELDEKLNKIMEYLGL